MHQNCEATGEGVGGGEGGGVVYLQQLLQAYRYLVAHSQRKYMINMQGLAEEHKSKAGPGAQKAWSCIIFCHRKLTVLALSWLLSHSEALGFLQSASLMGSGGREGNNPAQLKVPPPHTHRPTTTIPCIPAPARPLRSYHLRTPCGLILCTSPLEVANEALSTEPYVSNIMVIVGIDNVRWAVAWKWRCEHI